MALISLRQLLDHAAEYDYGVPAFNVNNMEQIQAIMAAAHGACAPVIVQASRGARQYAGDTFLRHLMLAAVADYPHIRFVCTKTMAITRKLAYRLSPIILPA